MVKGTAHGWVNCELCKWKTKLASTVGVEETQGKKSGEAGGNVGSLYPTKLKTNKQQQKNTFTFKYSQPAARVSSP